MSYLIKSDINANPFFKIIKWINKINIYLNKKWQKHKKIGLFWLEFLLS